tara:strand:- start:802 stop:990 length:189 start_codon:yes stop_codon:yes gene_type:complete
MTKLEKIVMAKQQIENILTLIEDNEYTSYMSLKLTSVWYELDRQESLLKPVAEVAQGDGTAP